MIAFANLFDEAFALKKTVELALNRNVHLHLLTDSKSLFDIISKGSPTNEKRLMLDIHAAREGYKAHDIRNIGFVRSEQNIADGLTTCMKQESLRELARTGKLRTKVEQRIIRKPVDAHETRTESATAK